MSPIEKKELRGFSYIGKKECIPTWKLPMFCKNTFKDAKQRLVKLPEQPLVFARYSNLDWANAKSPESIIGFIKMMFKKWQAEAGIATSEQPEDLPAQLIYSEVKSAANSLQTIHKGPYHKVGDTYNRIIDFAKEQQLTLADESIEIYLNDPAEVKPDELETKVIVPLKNC